MSNKYCNLDGTKKIKDEYGKINIGFDSVETDMDLLHDRVEAIITSPAEGVSAQEIIDARKGEATLRAKVDSIDSEIAVERARITNLATLATGSTTGDAELIDARVGADGVTYASAGDANRGQFSKHSNKISSIENVLSEQTYIGTVQTGKLGSSDSTVIDNAFTYLLTADVTGLDKVFVTGASNTANYFIVVLDATNTVLYRPAKDLTNTTYINHLIHLPSGSVKLFINSRIDAPKPTCYKNVLQAVASKVKTLEQNTNLYKNINYGAHNDLVEWLGAFGGTFANNVSTVTAVNQGVRTNNFIANSSATKIKLDCDFTTDFVSVQIGINKSDASVAYQGVSIDNTGGTLTGTFDFDSANLNIYSDAVSFFVIVNSTNSSNPGTITINELIVYEPTAVELHDMYDDSFIPMVEKIFTNIEQNKNSINSIIASSSSVLIGADADKYDLQIGASGSLIAVPHIPSKTIFMGNSLLLGIDTNGTHGGAFGMAATDYTKDYAYQVEQAILSKNPTATFSKLHVATFEQAESDSAAQSYIDANSANWTEDLDLVIIQLSENVNSDIRRATFANNFSKLIKRIRTNSPKARVLCVCGWYNTLVVNATILDTCKMYSCKYLNIRDLYVTGNFPTLGATVTYKDNTTTTIPDTWLSHPGNAGHLAIGNKIITVLDM